MFYECEFPHKNKAKQKKAHKHTFLSLSYSVTNMFRCFGIFKWIAEIIYRFMKKRVTVNQQRWARFLLMTVSMNE